MKKSLLLLAFTGILATSFAFNGGEDDKNKKKACAKKEACCAKKSGEAAKKCDEADKKAGETKANKEETKNTHETKATEKK